MPSMPAARDDLIIDAGLFNGNDTAYYLALGFRVLAIDADPNACEAARRRFSAEIESRRLEILNAGIATAAGELIFYRCTGTPAHSTFDAARLRNRPDVEPITVQCLPLAGVIAQHGIPHYIKIDIEGRDEDALRSLTPALAPPYISAELSDDDSIIEVLRDLGYRGFKLINQATFTTSTEIAADDYLWRALRKLGLAFPPFKSLMKRLPHALRPRVEWDIRHDPDNLGARLGCMSGPFGEATHGAWLPFQRAKARIDWSRRRFPQRWWDIHARK